MREHKQVVYVPREMNLEETQCRLRAWQVRDRVQEAKAANSATNFESCTSDMDTNDLIFRTVFVDRDVDLEVLARAKRLGTSPASVFRSFLEAGLENVRRGKPIPASKLDASVVRTVYISVAADESLSALGCRLGVDKSELLRKVTRQGMLTVQES